MAEGDAVIGVYLGPARAGRRSGLARLAGRRLNFPIAMTITYLSTPVVHRTGASRERLAATGRALRERGECPRERERDARVGDERHLLMRCIIRARPRGECRAAARG